MKELNQKALDILNYIRSRSGNEVPPTVREICRELGIKSTSTAHRYLGELEERGYISKSEGLNRSIRLGRGESPIMVPLVGGVTAGQPALAVEEHTDYVPYYSRSGAGDFFALRIKGESMIKAGILDGDVIVVRRTASAENGQIVVALMEDETTVKRFFRENGRFRLQPENDSMEPIYADELSVLGIVVACVRHYE